MSYKEAVKRFYQIYNPLRKCYDIRLHTHFSIYDNGCIEVYQYEGENKKQILRVKEENEIDCYIRAADELLSYQNKMEERYGRIYANYA